MKAEELELTEEEIQKSGVNCFIEYPKHDYKLGKQVSHDTIQKIKDEATRRNVVIAFVPVKDWQSIRKELE